MSDLDIARLERERDVDGLLSFLANPDADLRAAAAAALGRLGDARAEPALNSLLEDPYSVDPADRYHGDRVWEEMGDESLIYPVRDAAREALKQIASQQGGESAPLATGDLVRRWRYFEQGRFNDGGGHAFMNSIWRLSELGPQDAFIVLEKGEYWDYDPAAKKGAFRKPWFSLRLKNSDDYNRAFPGSLPYQEFLDTFKKVG